MPRRTKSSQQWLAEHFSDPFVKRAHAEGWRSRAVFKLEELDKRERLLRAGLTVLDLGAAPGASTLLSAWVPRAGSSPVTSWRWTRYRACSFCRPIFASLRWPGSWPSW